MSRLGNYKITQYLYIPTMIIKGLLIKRDIR